ncbi:MAG: shufflon system plasmid conjugative transfer pilus tip adhesin PilV [Candidatus Gracilibacteria bacterium]|nr:shufflon system plasmid conjugative transfer pilus tip adhesin PilV [Candidatus Gracilibacteria bacterium]
MNKMNKTLIKLGKNIVLQLVSFSILIGFVAFAAISWPSSTPTGETSGGKFASYFSKMLLGCPAGQVLKGFQSDGTRLCSQVGTSEIANNAIDQTKVQNGYVDLSSNQTIGGTKTFGVLASGKVQIIDVVTENTACSPNGLIAKDSTGLLLSCQSGLWKKASGSSGGFWSIEGAASCVPEKISSSNWRYKLGNGGYYNFSKGPFDFWTPPTIISGNIWNKGGGSCGTYNFTLLCVNGGVVETSKTYNGDCMG